MHHVGELLHVHELRDRHGARLADPADVVPAQVHQHDVLGPLFLTALQFRFVGLVLTRRRAPGPGPGDGMGGGPAGVDIDELGDGVWMAEDIMGRELYGHVSKAGPRPKTVDKLYDMNMPFVETTEQAKHFKVGAGAYEGGIYPYSEPITSPYRERVEKGLPAFDPAGGDFPWKQDWFPAKD